MSVMTLQDKYLASTAPNVVLARQAANGTVSIKTLVPPSILVSQYTSEFNDRTPGNAVAPTNTSFTSAALAIYDKEISNYVDSSIFMINENASAKSTWYLSQRNTTPGALYATVAAPFSS